MDRRQRRAARQARWFPSPRASRSRLPSRWASGLLGPVLLLLSLAAGGCGGSSDSSGDAGAEARALATPAAHNLIFILVDTLRADHLPLYGYGRATSPNLSALGHESVVFLDNRSQAPCTFPSVNSMLTSRSAAAFLGQPGGAMGLPAGIPGLAEMLRAQGFHTHAISASPIVRNSPGRFNPGGGFGRGFDSFQEDCVWRSADCVTDQALQHLPRDPRPLFLYLHYLDPHGPYAPPPGYARRFALGHPAKDFVRLGDPNPIAAWLYKHGPNPGLTAADLSHLVDLYDDKISFFDSQLGRLLAGLRTSGLLDDSIVVFAADHGEEFLEHGDVKHCHNLFDTTIRTPLLLRVPGARPRTVAEPVSNLDIVPTVLDLLGVGGRIGGLGAVLDSPGPEGHSLRPALLGHPLPLRYQMAAQGVLRSVADGRLKLVHDLGTDRFTLYDLAADPGETRDVLADRRRDVPRLRDALSAWLARTEGGPAAAGVRRAQEADRRLRSVGYLDH
jgi:arylsulfatase A-like enzyme